MCECRPALLDTWPLTDEHYTASQLGFSGDLKPYEGNSAVMETIAHWVSHYGYVGIFSLLLLGIVGIPVPDEWLLAFAGYLVYKHNLLAVPTFASAFLGSACGITISYGLGRSVGFFLIHKYGRYLHVTPERINWVHDWFGRVGTWALMLGYFIPGVRHLTAIAAGTSKLRPLIFGLFAYSGAFLWTGTFIFVGYFFGEQWHRGFDQIEQHVGIFTWFAFAVLCIWMVLRIWRKPSKPGS